ncbi:prepilin-type N-terminal cleavage/methylation domain-containing protein [Actinoplanes hulinensis]|uniref:Prepilin-type N-terminal cleavage/methylation domain-containing protein n=2 Tax=Actinoplanes hulinensis TaxID=1144547 RepID=A0ABS7AUA8_9ACTN|nr:prepilin-type N-terminal cleavage/methylation domain-containing protein [Actinoplanes hulinensis]
MQDIIARLRAGKKNDEGFTLIELLVVVVIIGVLVAIAVPVYLNYRQGAADKSAQSDVRGAISAVEQFYTENNNSYPTTTLHENNADGQKPTLKMSTATDAKVITLSDKTELTYVVGTKAGTYKICATNSGGSGKVYLYDSEKGGSVKDAAVKIASCVA